MKTRMVLIFFLFFLCSVPGFAAEDDLLPDEAGPLVSQNMINILNANLENLFPITSQKIYFSAPEEAKYSDVGAETAVRIGTEDGKRYITLVANADGVREYSAFTGITEAYPTNFQITADVSLQDVYPEGSGGCFVGFTNYGISAYTAEDGAGQVVLLLNGQGAEIYICPQGAESGSHFIISETSRWSGKLSLIHLLGHTYAYFNGTYLGQYHDGVKGPVQLIYGASTFGGGDIASCSFDNLVVKKVDSK